MWGPLINSLLLWNWCFSIYLSIYFLMEYGGLCSVRVGNWIHFHHLSPGPLKANGCGWSVRVLGRQNPTMNLCHYSPSITTGLPYKSRDGSLSEAQCHNEAVWQLIGPVDWPSLYICKMSSKWNLHFLDGGPIIVINNMDKGGVNRQIFLSGSWFFFLLF